MPLVVDGLSVGNIVAQDAATLAATGCFAMDGAALSLSATLASAGLEDRNAAIAVAMNALRDAGVVTGWRDELVPVAAAYGSRARRVLFGERVAARSLDAAYCVGAT